MHIQAVTRAANMCGMKVSEVTAFVNPVDAMPTDSSHTRISVI